MYDMSKGFNQKSPIFREGALGEDRGPNGGEIRPDQLNSPLGRENDPLFGNAMTGKPMFGGGRPPGPPQGMPQQAMGRPPMGPPQGMPQQAMGSPNQGFMGRLAGMQPGIGGGRFG